MRANAFEEDGRRFVGGVLRDRNTVEPDRDRAL
jgi:hypothetical protein